MAEIVNHLWQSTLFAALVALAAIALRGNQAKTRYWLWLAASMKFLIPFSLLVSLGSRVDTPGVRSVVPAIAVEQISNSFAPVSAPTSRVDWWPSVAVGVWLLGSAFLLTRWLRRWLTLHAALRNASRSRIAAPIPVFSLQSPIEPGVFGIIRPVLLLPDGIIQKLSTAELDAIIAHELTHVRRRDNLTAAMHMVVETLFWFHPLVWWLGTKLVEERERACDESVLEKGSQPQDYAQGIVAVCRHYLASPLRCAAGVSGADLKQRIEQIMTHRIADRLTPARKMLLTGSLLSVLAAPLVIGLLQAQTLPPPPAYGYEVATVKPSHAGDENSRIGPGPQGGLLAQNVTVMQLLRTAYELQAFQFAGAPGWATTSRFDVAFTPDRAEITPDPSTPPADFVGLMSRQRQRLQAVLRDRFHLVLRTEKRELPFLALAVAKGGAKLAASSPNGHPNMRATQTSISATAVRLDDFARHLASVLGRHVENETGLDGRYDFELNWKPTDETLELTETDRSSAILTALNDQLGLKTVSKKGPVPVFLIEKIEKPAEN